MARLSKEVMDKRRAFVASFVKKNKKANDGKGPTAEAINDALSKAFKGVKMRPQEVYKLKKLAMTGPDPVAPQAVPQPVIAPAPVTTAGRNPGKRGPGRPPNAPTEISIAGRNPGEQPVRSENPVVMIPLNSERGLAIVREALTAAGLALA